MEAITPTTEQPVKSREAVEFSAAAMRRIEWLLVMTAVLLAVCAYGLRLQDSWLLELRASITPTPGGWRSFVWGVLEPFISFYVSPLIFKAALAATPMA